jgi:hypothetical protein
MKICNKLTEIISLVQEPIVRNISAFFKNFRFFIRMENPYNPLDVE